MLSPTHSPFNDYSDYYLFHPQPIDVQSKSPTDDVSPEQKIVPSLCEGTISELKPSQTSPHFDPTPIDSAHKHLFITSPAFLPSLSSHPDLRSQPQTALLLAPSPSSTSENTGSQSIPSPHSQKTVVSQKQPQISDKKSQDGLSNTSSPYSMQAQQNGRPPHSFSSQQLSPPQNPGSRSLHVSPQMSPTGNGILPSPTVQPYSQMAAYSQFDRGPPPICQNYYSPAYTQYSPSHHNTNGFSLFNQYQAPHIQPYSSPTTDAPSSHDLPLKYQPFVPGNSTVHHTSDSSVVSEETRSTELLSQLPPTIRHFVELKSKVYLPTYFSLIQQLPTQTVYVGYFLGSLSQQRKTAWISCSDFPDNVFCDLRKLSRDELPYAVVGGQVQFSVILNTKPQSYFAAENPRLVYSQMQHPQFTGFQ